jgi:hypothetical protein
MDIGSQATRALASSYGVDALPALVVNGNLFTGLKSGEELSGVLSAKSMPS